MDDSYYHNNNNDNGKNANNDTTTTTTATNTTINNNSNNKNDNIDNDNDNDNDNSDDSNNINNNNNNRNDDDNVLSITSPMLVCVIFLLAKIRRVLLWLQVGSKNSPSWSFMPSTHMCSVVGSYKRHFITEY